MDCKQVLFALTQAVGVSGAEQTASAYALSVLSHYASDARMDSFGNVTGTVGTSDPAKPTLLLDAHIDEIGLIVTYVDEAGFVKVGSCGGVDRRLLLAQQVTIHGTQPVTGVICSKPPHLEKGDEHKKVPEIDAIAIDTGYSREQLEGLIAPGDRVTLHTTTKDLLNGRVTGKSMEDRSGVAAILYALELLKDAERPFNLTVLFSAQEEVGSAGAHVAAYTIAPDYAIAIDVSFAHSNDTPEHKCGKMGEGPMIGVSPTLSAAMSDRLIALAKAQGLPYQIEVMPGRTSTNADAIGVTKGGARTATVSIPLRYMHTPVETLALADIEATAQLLCAYAKEGIPNA